MIEVDEQPYIPSQPSHIQRRPEPWEIQKARFFGRVKYFNQVHGNGFIVGDDKRDVFFNISEYRIGKPTLNARVSFSVRQTQRGLTAVNIKCKN
jgi:cold shock CspA family protein